jgi:hypothetical protein
MGRGERAPARGLVRLATFLALLSFTSLVWVGLAGGRIRHPEVGGTEAVPAERDEE